MSKKDLKNGYVDPGLAKAVGIYQGENKYLIFIFRRGEKMASEPSHPDTEKGWEAADARVKVLNEARDIALARASESV